MQVSDLERRAADLAHRGLDLEELCLACDRLLRRDVRYAVAAWATHDPATGLHTSCTMVGISKDTAR
ncbi:MAG TPA: hypothetical protein VGW38_25985, partial [Chloroflexota bacterium]|nr:hypothetical protein [Chloroflexota bacterium]